MRSFVHAFILAAALAGASPAAAPPATKDTCVECHAAIDDGANSPASLFNNDIHKAKGLSCADCHGGDRGAEDSAAAMSRAKGFIGKPARTQIPKTCARCHSNAGFMHKFGPQERVDQYEMYLTSTHGKRLAAGDTNVATCIDCHSVHQIRAVKDPLSPVHPLRLPETCAKCHADKSHMARYKIPTSQFEDYRTSVHWNALSKRGDLSAPSCATCHGNHGAAPPNSASVSAVCSSCHVMFGRLYEKSPHQAVFSLEGGACVVCHSNHAIQKPSTKMLAGQGAVCAKCHDAESSGGKTAVQMAQMLEGLDAALNRSRATLESARNYGMEVSEAQVRLIDGQENLVKARLAVHAFKLEEVKGPVDAGLKVANDTLKTGQASLREKDMRRLGLGVSVGLILVTLLALYLLIRRIEGPPEKKMESAAR